MAFIRIRTINGKQYEYLEERYREGGKVRTRSVYLGPVSKRNPVPLYEPANIEKMLEEYGRQLKAEEGRLAIAKDKLSKELGVDLSPTTAPIDKGPTAASEFFAAERASPAQSPSHETAPDVAPSAPGEADE